MRDVAGERAPALAAKLDALRRGARFCRAWDLPSPARTGRAWLRAVEVFASEQPHLLRLDGDELYLPALGVRFRPSWDRMEAEALACVEPSPALPASLRDEARAWLQAGSPRERLVDGVALALAEDLVVVAGEEAGAADRAELLHVCHASGWSAHEKLGLDFAAIHAPVPERQPLLDAHRGLVRTFIARGPFVRWVWGLHTDGALCHDPHLHTPAPEGDLGDPDAVARRTWFRTERQTLLGVPDANRALFTIRVRSVPLPDVIDRPERARLLAASLRDMSDGIAAYKGLVHRRAPLLAWLDARAS